MVIIILNMPVGIEGVIILGSPLVTFDLLLSSTTASSHPQFSSKTRIDQGDDGGNGVYGNGM